MLNYVWTMSFGYFLSFLWYESAMCWKLGEVEWVLCSVKDMDFFVLVCVVYFHSCFRYDGHSRN
jgi:hypothetical protein